MDHPSRRNRGPGDIQGTAQITHIWMTQTDHYRECLLRITYDNTPFSSVLAPLSDFHCWPPDLHGTGTEDYFG
jgi:hypothetical protein